MRRVLPGLVAALGAASCAHGQGPDRSSASADFARATAAIGEPTSVPTASARGFEQLRGRRLATAIRGRTIVPRRAPVETPSSEQLRADGTYVYRGDRVQAHGTYRILNDRYCATVGSVRRCSSLHRDADGNYYRRQMSPVASGYVAVLLTE